MVGGRPVEYDLIHKMVLFCEVFGQIQWFEPVLGAKMSKREFIPVCAGRRGLASNGNLDR